MTTVADFAPFVDLKVRHAPTPNIHHAIRESLITFMRLSRAAVDEVYIDVPCGEAEVIVQPHGCQRLVSVEGVFLDPSCAHNSRWNPNWVEVPSTDRNPTPNFWSGAQPYGWWMDDVGGPNETMWLYPEDSKAKRVCVRYAWSIKRDNCEVPDWIYEDYADAIADGATTLLHLNPTDPDVSVPFGKVLSAVFMEGVNNARRRKEMQYRRRQVNVANAGFFRG